jgi:hypothetical protein
LGEASPPQVEVGRGDVLGRAEGGDGLITGREAFEAFNPLTVVDRVRTGAKGRVGHGGILREKERMAPLSVRCLVVGFHIRDFREERLINRWGNEKTTDPQVSKATLHR